MSVQVRRRREAAAFLSTFVGAQGELLVDTTNNRVQVHDGTTPGGWPAAKLADVAQRTGVADANYTVLPTDRIVAYTALSASRIVTLPAASAYPTGTQLLFVDETGACSPFVVITIARTGTDTVNGLPSALISSAYGFLALTSNGKGAWTAVDFSGATTAQLTNRNAIINGNFAINQRGYASGTALSAGSYAHDRFKAGSNGCAYTFTQAVPDTIVTITAGSLLQVIEGANLFSSTMWLTWTGTASARAYQGTASSQTSPAYAAGTPATISGTVVNMLAVSGMAVGSNTTIEFTSGSIGLVQCEVALPNAGPTRFERRYAELTLCQRYYQKSYDPGIAPGTVMGNGGCTVNANAPTGGSVTDFLLPVVMRATPTTTIFDGTATAGKVSYYGNSGWTGGATPSVIYPHPQRLFVQTNIAGSYQVNFDYVLNAEI